MIRIDATAAALAVLCSVIQFGCDSDTTKPFKPSQDGSTSSGGSDSGSTGGATSTGGSSAGGGSGGGATTPDAAPAGKCGGFFGHTDACKTCLETNCCDLGAACAKVSNCPALAACTRDCDAKGGTMGDTCRTDCNAQFLTNDSRPLYNALVQCMGQSCLSQCPFHGP